MKIKHFQTKSGRYTTALVYPDGNRKRYDYDSAKIILALAIVNKDEIDALLKEYNLLGKLSLLMVQAEWEIYII